MKTTQLYPALILALIGSAASGRQSMTIDSSMALIPAGEFVMGKNLNDGYDFGPAHTVRVDSFFMDKHEVTNGEYLRFCTETGHGLPEFWNTDNFRSGEDYPGYPVIGISWRDAKEYAEWAGKRLPTEAEWEYAARGGLIDKDYPNGDEWTKKKAVQEPGGWTNLIDPVEKYEPNGFGLYDMSGNVWEWVYDVHSADYYSVSETDNPKGPKEGNHRVIRGGSWHSGPMCKRVYYRKAIPGNWCDFAVGFRCARDVAAETETRGNK
jgi:formylglycine-generating enzyme required for sulfatase activity